MILRFVTVGSVDDGKSTLIGRLLKDTESLYQDQWQSVQALSLSRGDSETDLALLTDGLRDEREQRITIDVAYRHFATPRRRFLIADSPGHEQYTRNMVTGASSAELAVLLLDARKGISIQSKRHGFLSGLLGIPNLVVAINKMDLQDYEEDVFQRICQDYSEFASRLQVTNVTYIPISALQGDNVVERSPRMSWYRGPTLLQHLETVRVGSTRNVVDFRLPIQMVLRPHQDFRGFAGRVASGRIRVGDSVLVLPSGSASEVTSLTTPGGAAEEAYPGDSVVLTLAEEIEAGRGSMFVRTENLPQSGTELDATLCWMDGTPLDPNSEYWLRHTTRRVKCRIKRLNYRIDVNSMQREASPTLKLNEIGRVQLSLSSPIFFDSYRQNRATGNFILEDAQEHGTVAAGMIRGTSPETLKVQAAQERNLSPEAGAVSRAERERSQGHPAAVLWLTGLSGAGKSTLARRLERELFQKGYRTIHFDGDNLRHGLNSDLGFSARERQENIRRVAELSCLAFENGLVVLCSFISPFQRDRDFARSLFPKGRFFEIYVECELATCQQRDPKGLYQRALAGEIKDFTGLDSPYEEPSQPELTLDTSHCTENECLDKLKALFETGFSED